MNYLKEIEPSFLDNIVSWFQIPIEKSKPNIRRKNHETMQVNIPYKKLEIIQLLQRNYDYEVNGTLNFDEDGKFKSFNTHTILSPVSSEREEDWSLSFHTHPAKTTEKYGLHYFSPPSIEDIMEIFEKEVADTHHHATKLGEISLIFANEGIYILQVDPKAFRKKYGTKARRMTEQDLEDYLKATFNPFITDLAKVFIEFYYMENNFKGPIDYQNPEIPNEEWEPFYKALCEGITKKYGFSCRFKSWNELKRNRKGLQLTVRKDHI